jgi:hypothetical protein
MPATKQFEATVSGVGLNKSGDVILRRKNDNKAPPFWGTNLRTNKRGRAIELAVFREKLSGSA